MHSMCVKRRAKVDGRQQQGPKGRRDSTHMAAFRGEAGVQQGHNVASALEALEWIHKGLHPWHTGKTTRHNAY